MKKVHFHYTLPNFKVFDQHLKGIFQDFSAFLYLSFAPARVLSDHSNTIGKGGPGLGRYLKVYVSPEPGDMCL